MAEENTTVTEEVSGEKTSVTIGDIATMVNVIDAGSQRGAWKGEEMAVIGSLRNKLAARVNEEAPAAQEGEAAEGEEVAADGTPAEAAE